MLILEPQDHNKSCHKRRIQDNSNFYKCKKLLFMEEPFKTLNDKGLKVKGSFVGNKAKGRISKRVFQESKARQNFRKTNISYSLILFLKSVRNLLETLLLLREYKKKLPS